MQLYVLIFLYKRSDIFLEFRIFFSFVFISESVLF